MTPRSNGSPRGAFPPANFDSAAQTRECLCVVGEPGAAVDDDDDGHRHVGRHGVIREGLLSEELPSTVEADAELRDHAGGALASARRLRG